MMTIQKKPSVLNSLHRIKNNALENLNKISLFGRRNVTPVKLKAPFIQTLTTQAERASLEKKLKNYKVTKASTRSKNTQVVQEPCEKMPDTLTGPAVYQYIKATVLDNNNINEKAEVVAGHAKNFVLLNHSQIAKRTSQDEWDVYENRKTYGLDHVMAGHITVSNDDIDNLPEDAKKKIQELNPSKYSKEIILILDQLGAEIETRNKRVVDIKLGHATASQSQLKNIGHKKATQKKIRMKAFDILTGSSRRGFRLAGGSIHGKKIKGNRMLLGWESESKIANILVLPEEQAARNFAKIIADLKVIKQAAMMTPVTFIGCSVLMVVDDENPKKTQAKLIDFSNPIYQNQTNFSKSKQRFILGIDNLIKNIENISLSHGVNI